MAVSRAAQSQLGQWPGFWLIWTEGAGAVVRGKGALRGGRSPGQYVSKGRKAPLSWRNST